VKLSRPLIAILVLSALLIAPPAFAQTLIRGVVVDDSGGGLPGATVTIIDPASVAASPSISAADGAFEIEARSGKPATIHVELPGFQPVDVTTALPAPRPLTIRMQVAYGEEVTVTGSRGDSVVAATRNADVIDFDPEALRRLPTDAQDLKAVVDAFTAAAPAGGVSVVIDGVETDGASVPTAAIERLTINRSPYSVEYKSPGKARVEVETSRGSRRFYHGSGAVFFRNDRLQAQDAFASAKPPLTRELHEATIGGPLLGKAWSFFLAGQRLVDDGTSIVNAWTLAGPISQNVAAPERRSTIAARVDVRPNKADALTIKYDLFDESERNRGAGGLRLAEQGYDSIERRHRFQVSDHRAVAGETLNDVRVEMVARRNDEGAPPRTAAVVVAGAFAGGGAQEYVRDRSTSLQIQDVVATTIAAHPVRVGARLKTRSTDAIDGTNTAGTYRFDTLAAFAEARPVEFARRSRSDEVAFTNTDADVFAETTLRPTSSVGVTAGVRYEIDTRTADWNNVAPRIAIAVAPYGSSTVVRGGIGVFYQSLPQDAISRALVYGDSGVGDVTIVNPPFPALPSLAAAASEWRLAASLEQPRTTQGSIAVERRFGRRSVLTAEYLRMQTVHAFRTRDVNAPRGLARPDASRLNVFEIGSTGESDTDALTVTLNASTPRLRMTSQYTLSRTGDDGSAIFALPADSVTLAGEFGRADFDRRHRMNLAGTYGWKKDRLRVGAVLAVASAAPLNLLAGSDANHDLVATDRPAGVDRNSATGPAFAQLDLRFTTVFRAPRPSTADPQSRKRENTDNLELAVDLFNALDRVNAAGYVGVVTSPLFGRATSGRLPRTAQLSMRYRF
jgi:hypothetical protein